jgi:predicted dehydrogenase
LPLIVPGAARAAIFPNTEGRVIRLGIVGCNYGRNVLLPAFRADRRCEVVALSGSDAARTQALARESGIARGHARWEELVADASVDAVAIAVPPALQSKIALRALQEGKAVFAEKPLADSAEAAYQVVQTARAGSRPFAIDFEFPELPAWRKAKALIENNAIGRLRHLSVTWHVETYATRMRLKTWRTDAATGGALGNFVSHSLHYMEYFCGTMRDMSANIFTLPDAPDIECGVELSGRFENGASYALSMNAAAYLGTGHRLEFYGEDGTIVLENKTPDHARGFTLHHARRPAAALEQVPVAEEGQDYPDGRIAPVARIAKRFLDAIETGAVMNPGISEAARVQTLLDAARFSKQIGSEGIMLQGLVSNPQRAAP